MAVYHYSGRSPEGRRVEGELEGTTSEAVAAALFNRGVTPLTITESDRAHTWLYYWQRWRQRRRVETEDLIMFCRQMATITRSGIPLVKGLRILAASMNHPAFDEALTDIGDRLEEGQQLSAAMHHHPKVFNRLFTSIVRVGEHSGRLDEAFEQLSDYLERDSETVKRIKSALRYPSFVLAALAVALAVINLKVIPAFAHMFEQFGAELPLPTRVLVGVSDFFVIAWPYLLMLSVGALAAWRYYVKTEAGARAWGRKKLRLPIVGDIVERASMARYARSFGLMLKSGLPLNNALTLCADVIDNPYLADRITGIREGIERGESLFQTHRSSGIFPPLVLQMVSVGEESGQVDRLMADMANFYEREVDYDVKRLSDRIEPLVVVAMAALVLILALGIFLPMWDMYQIQ